MRRNIFLMITLILIMILFSGCEQKKVIPISGEPIDMETRILQVSGQYLSCESPLVIVLTDNEFAKGKLQEEVTNLNIDIKPRVKGKAIWQSENKLHFIPDKRFTPNQEYKVTIYPKGRSLDDPMLTPLIFSFTAIGRETTDIMLDIYIDDKDNEQFWVQGMIEFSISTDAQILADATRFKYEGMIKNLKWETLSPTQFTFQSDILKKKAESKEKIEFRIDGDKLELTKDLVREINLEDYDKFKVRSVKTLNEDSYSAVVITFNESPAPDQNLKSLVTVTPNAEIKIELHQETMILSGNFQPGEEYTITLASELKSSKGKRLPETFESKANFNDIKPSLRFADDGVFLTGNDNDKIYFSTINLKKVTYCITRIYENNLCQFLQRNDLEMQENNWGYNNIYYTGKEVARSDLEIGEVRNQWLQHELDISKLIPKDEYGIFIVEFSTRKEFALYRSNPKIAATQGYSNNPLENSYYYAHGTIQKPVILTNIGITFKLGNGKSWSYVTNLQDANPVRGAVVKAYSLQNQLLAEGVTGSNGSCKLLHEDFPFYVTASYQGQQTVIKLSSDRWETSSFDVDGINAGTDEMKSFFYTERGVYRPGDNINMTIVMRNDKGSFPDWHPLNIKIMDPRNNVVLETVLKNGKDGVYHLPYKTAETDPTGNWVLRIEVGENVFSHTLKIETVAPERLKLSFEPETETIAPDVTSFDITLTAKYLFGRAAAGLTANLKYHIDYVNKRFEQPRWNEFSFRDVTLKKTRIRKKTEKKSLDNDGKTTFTWQRDEALSLPSAGILRLSADVIDKGGRASTENINLPWNPWQAYVGIRTDNSFLQRNKENEVEIVLLDNDGNLISGEELTLKIYENSRHWWWEYNDRDSFMQHFKTMSSTRLLQEQKLISTYEPIRYLLPKISSNNVLIEVTHNTPEGNKHVSSTYLYTRNWSNRNSRNSASIMELSADKDSYNTGETAKISFPTTATARNLVTIEKADQILDWWWADSESDKEKTQIQIPLTEEMTPGVYVSVSVIQPHKETANDCPLRMYGIIPLKVVNPQTKENLILTVPEIIRPSEKFTCNLQALPDTRTQFTIAVVDEGLLSLTNFRSPDPWEYFYGKERLGISTHDCFDNVASFNKGTINKRFSVGGGMESREMTMAEFQQRQLENTEVKRFEPVCLFSGIQKADANGKLKVEFDMPDYLGAVRIMAVSISGDRYGSIAKTVKVRKELMLLPTLPRALAPSDTFSVPVEVFCFDENIKEATVTLEAEGPLNFLTGNRKTVKLDQRGEGSVYFEAVVLNELKPIKVTASVSSGNYSHTSIINIPVRHLQPYQLISTRDKVIAGSSITLNLDRDGLTGTEDFSLQLIRPRFFDYNKHLQYLIRYPYGCLEQKVSAVFPQLYIKDLVRPEISLQLMGDIDNNINSAIDKIKRHQQLDGSFSYWRGRNSVNTWACIYAVHFLMEANLMGYYVPPNAIAGMLRYLRDSRLTQNDFAIGGKYKTEAYRLYVLARAGEPEISSMNYLRENHLEKLDNAERWLLAGAYEAAGQHDVGVNTLKFAGWDVPFANNRYYHNFSSVNRDRAIILAIATQMGYEQQTEKLYFKLADELNSENWYSTQTRAFMLWAMSSYVKKNPELLSNDKIMGSVKNDYGDNVLINTTSNDWATQLKDCRNVKVTLSDNSVPARFQLNYDRVPGKAVPQLTNEYFTLSRKFTDSDGEKVDLQNMMQGESYTMKLQVKRTRQTDLEHLALSQILPSGWEIINDRLDDSTENMRDDATYTDIRDDRVLWFFPATKNNYNDRTFTIRIRAVTAGNFEVPPAILEAMYSPDYTVILPGNRTKIARQ